MTSYYIKKLNHHRSVHHRTSTIFLDARPETPYKVSGRFVARGSGLSAWLASGLGLIDAQLLFLPVTACRWLELLVCIVTSRNHKSYGDNKNHSQQKATGVKICCRYVRWNDVCNSMFAFRRQWNTIIRKENQWIDDHCMKSQHNCYPTNKTGKIILHDINNFDWHCFWLKFHVLGYKTNKHIIILSLYFPIFNRRLGESNQYDNSENMKTLSVLLSFHLSGPLQQKLLSNTRFHFMGHKSLMAGLV